MIQTYRSIEYEVSGKDKQRNKEISETTGYHKQYITDIVGIYTEKGIEIVIGNHYKGNNRRMSYEKEKEFLEQFHKNLARKPETSVEGC